MLNTFLHTSILLAAASSTAPDLAGVITKITSGLQPIFVPIATLGLTVFFILLLAGPVLPDGVQQNKGYFMKVCLVMVGIGIMPTLLTWLAGLGGAAPAALIPGMRFV